MSFKLKKSIFLLFVLLLYSCTRKVECAQFDYKGFGVDTNDLKKDKLYWAETNSITFKVREFETYNIREETESSFKVAECNNGVFIDLDCDSLKFFCSYSISIRDDGYQYMIVSPYFDMQIIKIKTLKDANLIINTFEENNGITPNIFSMVIKEARIHKIIDKNNRTWVERD